MTHATNGNAPPLPACSAEETNACFIVRDGNEKALAHFEDDPRRCSAAKLLTRDDEAPAHRRQHR
jgi:hypothetical protein